jgi:hypothetical protein
VPSSSFSGVVLQECEEKRWVACCMHYLLLVLFIYFCCGKKMTVMSSLFFLFLCEKDNDGTQCHRYPFLVWSCRSVGRENEHRVTHATHIVHCHLFFITRFVVLFFFLLWRKHNDTMCHHCLVLVWSCKSWGKTINRNVVCCHFFFCCKKDNDNIVVIIFFFLLQRGWQQHCVSLLSSSSVVL